MMMDITIDGIYDQESDDYNLLNKYSYCKVEECGLFVDIEKGGIKIMGMRYKSHNQNPQYT